MSTWTSYGKVLATSDREVLLQMAGGHKRAIPLALADMRPMENPVTKEFMPGFFHVSMDRASAKECGLIE